MIIMIKTRVGSVMKWVTREYVHVDRTACPWLIRKFIDPKAEFVFVSVDKIGEVVDKQGAIPFDAPGVKLGHRNGKCSFETIIKEYGLKDLVLQKVAEIVHSGDTSDKTIAPEGIGLDAIMTGIRLNAKDDYEAIQKAKIVYDSLQLLQVQDYSQKIQQRIGTDDL
jgi:hypothetical protein